MIRYFKFGIGGLNNFKMITVQIPVAGFCLFVLFLHRQTDCKVKMEKKIKYRKNGQEVKSNEKDRNIPIKYQNKW